jgi:hypothetical protein
MMKAFGASCITALVLVTGAWAGHLSIGKSATAPVPPCPQASYGVDGTMGPIFCVVDNPVALRYYGPMGKHLFALGPNASPQQVLAALQADYRKSTEPILCETYRLAAWRNHWHFPYSIAAAGGTALHFPSGWCQEPNFSRIGD